MEQKNSINAILFILFLFISSLTLPLKVLMNNGLSVWIATLIIIFLSLYNNKAIIDIRVLFIIIISLLFFCINLILVEYKGIVFNLMFEFIKYGLIPLYLASQVKINVSLYKYWYIAGCISTVFWLIFLNEVIDRNVSYMGFGIQMTYCFIIFTFYFYKNNKYRVLNLILMVLTFSLILILGNRVSVLTCIFIIAYFELRKIEKKHILYSITKISILITLILILFKNFQNIIYWIRDILYFYNIKSYLINKIIYMFNNGLFESSSGRDIIYKYSIDIIKEKSFLPTGVGYFEYATGYVYPHNVFLDLIITFGIISMPIIFQFIVFVKRNIRKLDKKNRIIIFTLLIFAFSRLFFSATFWTEPILWMIIGLLFIKKDKIYGNKISIEN